MAVFTRPDSKFWWYHVEGTRIRTKTEFLVGVTTTEKRDSKQLAELVWREAQQNHGKRRNNIPLPLKAGTFRAYAADYDSTIAGRKGADRERELLVPLKEFFGSTALTDITRKRVSDYLQHRTTKQPGGPKVASKPTANREVDLLKVMLRDAVPVYLTHSPLVGMKRLKAPPRRRRTLKPEEEKRLLKVATDPQDRALIILGLDTLQRLSALLSASRNDREGFWLDIRDTKNGEPNRVPLTARAVTALDAIPNDGEFYFSKFRKAKLVRDWRGSVNQRLEKLCAMAEPPVPFGLKAGVTFHGATRKTGVTRFARKGANRVAVQRLGGWKSIAMVDSIYTEVDDNDVLQLVGRKQKHA